MDDIEKLKEEIEKTNRILEESQLHLEQNPDDYSAKLLVLSTGNHLADLLKRLDKARK